jgi:hypothetical protein
MLWPRWGALVDRQCRRRGARRALDISRHVLSSAVAARARSPISYDSNGDNQWGGIALARQGDTRLLITDFLCEALGFDKFADLTTEYMVKGEFAD